MSFIEDIPNMNKKTKKIILQEDLNDFFKSLQEIPIFKREYDPGENCLCICILDHSLHGCKITISNVLGSSRIKIKPFYLADNVPSTIYTFDSFDFSTAMDTHLLTPEELMSKQQLVSEKKQEELRQKALKDAHDLKECVPTTCEFCKFEKGEREKLEKAKFLEEQEQARKDALFQAHYLRPKTCDPQTCEYCRNEEIEKYRDEKFAHEAKMRSTLGPYWRQIMGGGQGST